MTFQSILFTKAEDRLKAETLEAPVFFADLHIDQIVETLTAGKQEYHLQPFFYTSLNDTDAILYRQEIMRELENSVLFEHIILFSQKMRKMREYLTQANKLYYRYQKERWFLDAVGVYCDAVTGLVHDLAQVDLQARGFLAFRQYLVDYTSAGRFPALLMATQKLQADLATVRYCLLIKGNSVRVRRYEDESDYSAEVEATFAKFKQEAGKDYRRKFYEWPDMNHVEAQILELVARLYPDVFSQLENYCTQNRDYLDETLALFDREIQFYIAYLEYIARIKRTGLPFCYPHVCRTQKEVYAYESFDLALAHKLINEHAPVVCNDFSLRGQERILVVTGPNQGGKTTFARTFGQLHYFANLGCPVPGKKAQLFLFDRLLTHFEKEEHIVNLRGKLQDDLLRIWDILSTATPDSIVILNEIFTSTTLDDAVFLSKKIMEEIHRLDVLCVWVTFIDELASFSEKTVSMVSTVVPDNPAVRTYKIVRKPADGLSYAIALAEKYRLTYHCLKERLIS
ncbi:MAG: DNA mismatch repair protein MutS [Ktedonobacteraceae bacterium]|nr:DNA mismatch repair protein MutS [Ktedonobacteraceae bacterium]